MKRYDFYRDDLCDVCQMLEAEDGEYVLFNDLQETKAPPSFREDRLIEVFERYISQYGPGYSSTDTRAFDDAKAILAAVKQGGN